MMKIIQFPVLSDNYAYIVQCQETGVAALIDTPDAAALKSRLKQENTTPQMILNTHHHWDHSGGNEEISNSYDVSIFASKYDEDRIFGVTKTVGEGDEVRVGSLVFNVIEVSGHTLGHIAYYTKGILFCGDTVFVGGCGRLFEGTPAQMVESMQKIMGLPKETKIYCAHEYTENNLNFALGIEPGNRDLQKKIAEVRKLRQKGISTVPSTIEEELLYNPFMRFESEEIKAHLASLGLAINTNCEVFAAIRELKDAY